MIRQPEGDKVGHAVALRYRPGFPAPLVVAGGRKELARKIVDLARKHGVAIVEDADLASELLLVEPGNLIPEQLYRVVAELLAFAGRWDRLHRTEGNR